MAKDLQHIVALFDKLQKEGVSRGFMNKAQKVVLRSAREEVKRSRWVKGEAAQTFQEYLTAKVEGDTIVLSTGDFYGRFLEEGMRKNIKDFIAKTMKGLPANTPNDPTGKVLLAWARPEKQDELIEKMRKQWLPSGQTTEQLLTRAFEKSVPRLKDLLLDDVLARIRT